MNPEFSSSNCIGRYFVIALLPFLFTLFLLLNYYGVLNIVNVSSETFYIVTFIFVVFLFFIPHNAFIAICKIRSNFDVTRVELEKALENSALTIEGKTKSVLSVREFLEDYFKNVRNDNFAKVASSTFPMLGILGTFIAIAISMPDFTVSNTKELDRQISILLSGVGTAFYASIFGIFLSLVWIFFERLGLSRIENLTLSLEDIYSKYIWSQKDLLRFKYNQKTILDNEFVKGLKEVFNLDLIKEINKEHLYSYQKIIETTQQGLKELESSLLNSANLLNKSIEKLNATNSSVVAKETLEENIKEFNKAAKNLKELLESFDNGLDSSLKKIDRELAIAVRYIANMVDDVKKIKE